MKISGFNKLTLLDYPGMVACMIFTQGCNYKCDFCQNSGLICHDNEISFSEEEVLEYLDLRKKVLDGIVISGGEPTVQKDLTLFAKKVKQIGLKIKIDTNGSNPKVLKELIDKKLVDYIAMDIKNIFDEYHIITNVLNVNIDNIKESISLIKKSGIDHEFRTTIMKDYHSLSKIKEIASYLGKEEKYYLQKYELSDNVLNKNLVSFSKEELKMIEKEMKEEFPNVIVRGL